MEALEVPEVGPNKSVGVGVGAGVGVALGVTCGSTELAIEGVGVAASRFSRSDTPRKTSPNLGTADLFSWRVARKILRLGLTWAVKLGILRESERK